MFVWVAVKLSIGIWRNLKFGMNMQNKSYTEVFLIHTCSLCTLPPSRTGKCIKHICSWLQQEAVHASSRGSSWQLRSVSSAWFCPFIVFRGHIAHHQSSSMAWVPTLPVPGQHVWCVPKPISGTSVRFPTHSLHMTKWSSDVHPQPPEFWPIAQINIQHKTT